MKVPINALILLLFLATWSLFIENVQAGIFDPPTGPPSPSGTPSSPPSPSSDPPSPSSDPPSPSSDPPSPSSDPPSPSSDPPSPSGPGGGAADIQLVYLERVTPEVESVFEYAKQRWTSVFSDDFGGSVTLEEGSDLCGLVKLSEAVEIQDILILVLVTEIDGPGKNIGQAGPCLVDQNGLVRIGAFVVDTPDLEEIIDEGYGNITTVHYFAHVFGFGLFWEERDLVGEVTDPDHELEDYPLRYLGEEGNIGNEEVGLQFEAIVEDDGEENVAGIHWSENIYQDELMTAFFPESGDIILSKLTIRSLADLGYPVDPDAADDFEVDPDIVEDLEFGGVKAPGSNLRGSKSKSKNGKQSKRSFGNDILRKPIKVVKSNPKK